MALVDCPDCGHKVSTLATACPSCGRPADGADLKPEPPVEQGGSESSLLKRDDGVQGADASVAALTPEDDGSEATHPPLAMESIVTSSDSNPIASPEGHTGRVWRAWMSILGVWFLVVGGIRCVPSLLRIVDIDKAYPWPAAPVYYASLGVGVLMITGTVGYIQMQRWGAWTLAASWFAFFGLQVGFEKESTGYWLGVGIVVVLHLGALWATCAVRWSAFK